MKVYDCFSFNDENELLEIRLNYLKNIVDYFVIIECKYTHQGNIKGQKINLSLINKFKDKIKYFYLEEKINSTFSWEIESWQRSQISQGLKDCKPEDIIIVSDSDEIPNLEKINLKSLKNEVYAFNQYLLMYKLNLMTNRKWIGSKICKFSTLKSPQWLRQLKVHKKYSIFRIDKIFSKTYCKNFKIIENGGWHFGWLKSPGRIIEKVQSYAHTEHNIPKFKDKSYIIQCINQNINFLNGHEKLVRLKCEYLPKYIQLNLEKYKQWLI
ncbi:MAG: hypothetical protein ISQ17_00960 [Pelagibacteraceae bacterium]|nr:hypothetical protein [Pelagibacteraceae bacterium]